MSLIRWSDEYSLKIESIDNQHKKLVGYINQLHEAMMAGKGKDACAGILDGLVEYTINHFKYEETLFAKHGYAEEADHSDKHVKLVDQVRKLQSKLDAGETAVTTDVMNFLKEWLLNHILGEDKKYAPFMIAKGVK